VDKEVLTKFWKPNESGLQICSGFALAEVCTLRILSYVSVFAACWYISRFNAKKIY